MRWVVTLIVVASCSFQHGSLDDGAGGDAGNRRDAATTSTTDAASVASDAPPDAFACPDDVGCLGETVSMICNGACWVKCTNPVAIPNQGTAATACAIWGGELAPIRSAGDEACVEALFPSQASWIGFVQNFSTTLAGNWSWNLDGQPVTHLDWDQGQPNDFDSFESGDENCAMMNSVGKWHDQACGHGGLHRFSCRR